jgi:glycosyltransferase involved in cell wall biosynthesis
VIDPGHDAPQPVVSVVCPCRNSAGTLAQQLDALAAQRCSVPWEMIVVDDGSSDETVQIARSYVGRLPDLQVLETTVPRLQAEGINAGVAAARGRHVLVVDSDDEVAPGYLEAMHEALCRHPVVGARIDEEALNPPWARVRYHPMQRDGLSTLHGFLPVIVGAALGIRREVLDAVGGFDPASTPLIDMDLSWRLQLAGHPLAFAPDAVLRYRYRTGLRATFHQKRNYAVGDVRLAAQYAPHGLRRHHQVKAGVHRAVDVLGRLIRIRDRRSALLAMDVLGGAVGRVQGSIRYRHLFL